MRRDPTEFRKRFLKWKSGAKPYLYGIPYEDDNHNLDYDQARANQLGYTPDETGHYPSRDYETGRYLKSVAHPTVSKSIYTDMGLGYDVFYNLKDGLLYSQPNWGNSYKDRLPKYNDGKPEYKYVQAGADNSWSRITNDSNGDVFANLVVTPSKVKLNADKLYNSEPINSSANIKARSISIPRSIHQEPGLEITSPEFDVLSLGSGVLKELKRINSFKQVIKEYTGDKDQLKYNLLDWRGRKKGYITAHTYDNTPEIGFVKSDIPGGSRALYDAVIKDVTDKGMPGLYTGKDLLSAPKTYSVWKHYKDKILVGNNGQHSNMRMPGVSGNLKWSGDYNKMIQNWQNNIFDGTNNGAIYLLKTPSLLIQTSSYFPNVSYLGLPILGHTITE